MATHHESVCQNVDEEVLGQDAAHESLFAGHTRADAQATGDWGGEGRGTGWNLTWVIIKIFQMKVYHLVVTLQTDILNSLKLNIAASKCEGEYSLRLRNQKCTEKLQWN